MSEQLNEQPNEQPGSDTNPKPKPKRKRRARRYITEMSSNPTPAAFAMMQKADKDLLDASANIGRDEARYLVQIYYQVQKFRIQASNQARKALNTGEELISDEVQPEDIPDEDDIQAVTHPTRFIEFVKASMATIEKNVVTAMDRFSNEYRVSRWMRSICGIGRVLAGGYIARLDIREAATPSCFWRFAGLDPTVRWLKKDDLVTEMRQHFGEERWKTRGLKLSVPELVEFSKQRLGGRNAHIFDRYLDKGLVKRDAALKALSLRPWNASLKTLTWKTGQCFIKSKNAEASYYGPLLVARRKEEEERDLAGKNAERAAQILEQLAKRGKTYTPAVMAKLRSGHLSDGHLTARAARWTVKLFLSHLHHVMHVDLYGRDPVQPYVFNIPGTTHRHFIPVPNWPFDGGGLSLQALYDRASPPPPPAAAEPSPAE